MSSSRAIIRLWVVASVFWIGLWGWNDWHNCIPGPRGVLFCPVALNSLALVRTDYLHTLYFIFGPSLLALAGGLGFWWLIRRLRQRLERQ
jgi:hypothetical protein